MNQTPPMSTAGAALVTPVKRPRSSAASAGRAECAFAHASESQQARDADFVYQKLLEAGNEQLASYNASVLRDGILQRGMARAAVRRCPKELGRKLPPRVKYIRNLPKTFKSEWVNSQVAELNDEVADDTAPIEEVLTLDAQKLDHMICCALQMHPDCELPKDFHGFQFEGPMADAMTQRAVMCGNRLKNVTKEMLRKGTVGYFAWDKADPETLKVGEKTYSLAIPDDVKDENDLVLMDNCMPWTQLHSESTGFSLNLFKQIDRAEQRTAIVIITAPFTVDEATVEKYKDMAPVEATVSPPVAAPTAKAKAKARGKGTAKARAARTMRYVAVPR